MLSAKDLTTGALRGIQLHVALPKMRLRVFQGQVVFNAATRHQVHRGQGKGEEGLRSPEIWTSGYLSCWQASTGEADRSTLEHVAVSAHTQQILISWNLSWYGRVYGWAATCGLARISRRDAAKARSPAAKTRA